MPVAPDRRVGTRSPRTVDGGSGGGSNGPKKGGNKGGKPNVGQKGNNGKGKGGKKKKGGKKNFNLDMEPLNPPFDPRMRGIGSPLNQGRGMRRGWVQTEDDNLRVNFLFNPSELSLGHTVSDTAQTTKNRAKNDVTDGAFYASIGSTASFKLLYDRTYELYDNPKPNSLVGRFGVLADVAAWYTMLGMLPEMPTNWESAIITDPPQPKMAYLFMGPKMVYYGWLNGISVTYSHWTQRMVPVRCAIDVQMDLQPYQGDKPLRGQVNSSGDNGGLSWLDGLLKNPGGDFFN